MPSKPVPPVLPPRPSPVSTPQFDPGLRGAPSPAPSLLALPGVRPGDCPHASTLPGGSRSPSAQFTDYTSQAGLRRLQRAPPSRGTTLPRAGLIVPQQIPALMSSPLAFRTPLRSHDDHAYLDSQATGGARSLMAYNQSAWVPQPPSLHPAVTVSAALRNAPLLRDGYAPRFLRVCLTLHTR